MSHASPNPTGYERVTAGKISEIKHHPPHTFLRKHVFSLDHKVIGKQ